MKVAVCTPTRNRRWSWVFSRHCMDAQRQQPDMWIVLDNSDSPEADWSVSQEHPLVTYERIEGKRPIGALRNRCLEIALEKGADCIVFWDDDDYYPPTRISSGVEALNANPTADLAGSSMMYMLLTKENALMTTGPFHDRHATAATWTVRATYAQKHRFDPEKVRGEEPTFTDNWAAEIVQLKPEDVIVVLSHNQNTVDKSDVFKRPHVYNAKIVNSANGKMVVRMKWPDFPWDLFRRTFSV